MIDSKDISVVVQGAIDPKCTKKCLKSIRKYLPKAEIILSTWEGSNIEGLDFDILVENKDPGAVIQNYESNAYNNVNRQLVSTQNGLKKAGKIYTLKLRTDFFLKGPRFLKFFDKFPKRNKNFSFFEHKVIIPSVYSREYSSENKKIKIPFHPSDFYFFGLTEDIKLYFDNIPLMPDNELANYKFKNPERKPYFGDTFKFPPEQYFCLCFVQKFIPDLDFEDWSDWNKELCDISKHFIYSNFIFLGLSESQIYSTKHGYSMLFDNQIRGLITFKKFVKMYRRLFDKNYKPNETFIKGYLSDKFKLSILKSFIICKNSIRRLFKVLYYQFF